MLSQHLSQHISPCHSPHDVAAGGATHSSPFLVTQGQSSTAPCHFSELCLNPWSFPRKYCMYDFFTKCTGGHVGWSPGQPDLIGGNQPTAGVRNRSLRSPGCPFSSPNNRCHDVSYGVSIWVGIWGVRAAAGAEPWVCGMQHPHCVHPSPSGDLQPDRTLGPMDGKDTEPVIKQTIRCFSSPPC